MGGRTLGGTKCLESNVFFRDAKLAQFCSYATDHCAGSAEIKFSIQPRQHFLDIRCAHAPQRVIVFPSFITDIGLAKQQASLNTGSALRDFFDVSAESSLLCSATAVQKNDFAARLGDSQMFEHAHHWCDSDPGAD